MCRLPTGCRLRGSGVPARLLLRSDRRGLPLRRPLRDGLGLHDALRLYASSLRGVVADAPARSRGRQLRRTLLNGHHFDDLIRSLFASRRSLLSGGLALAAGWFGVFDATAKNKRKKKSQKNAFRCLNVGQKCAGKNGKCCSGICNGKKPKKGKKDRS